MDNLWVKLTNRRTQLINTENSLILLMALLELQLKGVQQEMEEVRFLLENRSDLEDLCDTESQPAPDPTV